MFILAYPRSNFIFSFVRSVVESQKKSCFGANKIQIHVSEGGYLASVVTEETGLGKQACPWVLVAKPGQRLNITLWDFTGPVSEDIYDRRHNENDVYKVRRSNYRLL